MSDTNITIHSKIQMSDTNITIKYKCQIQILLYREHFNEIYIQYTYIVGKYKIYLYEL